MSGPVIRILLVSIDRFLLPPTKEEQQIVEKVAELMNLCDELESKIVKSKEEGEKLIGAILEDVFKQ